jgi:hypothetical protein
MTDLQLALYLFSAEERIMLIEYFQALHRKTGEENEEKYTPLVKQFPSRKRALSAKSKKPVQKTNCFLST